FVQRENAERVASQPRGEPLPGKIGRATERIADPDVALAVDGRAGHPAIVAVRSVGTLLMQPDTTIWDNGQLVPPHATAENRRVHRVHRDDRLAPIDVPVHDPRHELVTLRV